jgi:hypothetical protein
MEAIAIDLFLIRNYHQNSSTKFKAVAFNKVELSLIKLNLGQPASSEVLLPKTPALWFEKIYLIREYIFSKTPTLYLRVE